MNSRKKTARLIGLLYLLLSIPGAFCLLYVPSVLLVRGDAAATAHNIMASELLFRSGIVGNLLCQAAFILVALALYRLLNEVHQELAVLMVILSVVCVPIYFVNELNHTAVLTLLSGAPSVSAIETPQRNALVMVFLDAYDNGNLVAEIFMGLWLLPFGILVFKSGFLPRILGVLLIIGCFAYLADSIAWLLWPAYAPSVSRFASVLRAVGELPTPLWLLIMGARDQPSAEGAT